MHIRIPHWQYGSVRAIANGEAGGTGIAADISGADVSVMLSDGVVYLRVDGGGVRHIP